jgi:D-xylose transport system substrate-binding protein
MKAPFYLKLSFITVCLFVFFSCNTNHSKKRIGFLIRTFQLDRCVKERDFFTEKINSLGGEVIIRNADNSDQQQINQGLELLNQGIDVLVIFPVNGQTSGLIVREAHKKKVPVIAYESLIENCDLDYFITADNKKGGELMTSYITNLAPNGDYILIGGDKSDKNAILIKEGQYNIIQSFVDKGEIKIKYDVYADWSAEEGYFETKKYLDLSNSIPRVILSSNDGLATGVIKALEERNLAGKVFVTGLDGELSALQRIAKGSQTVTIFKSFKIQAYEAADMAMQIANGKKPDKTKKMVFNGAVNVPSYLLEPVVVDKANLNEVIIKGGVFSEQEVYGNKN